MQRTSRLAVAVVALVATLLLAGPAAAGGKKAPSPFAVEVKELHEIKLLLARADRDYKGHRAEAVKQITAAIHALHAGHTPRHVKGGAEPQALSDAQLRESIKALNVVLAQLGNAPGAGAAKGAVHVANAIKQLEIALTIK